jgi:cellulose synthase/poly-beta-1,6-N-acetylglucosamine synthase-like glycosyltransferase
VKLSEQHGKFNLRTLLTEILTSDLSALLVIILYGIGALLIVLYSIGQFHLIYLYLKRNRKAEFTPKLPVVQEKDLPFVTVQIPMYNERYVAAEVIDACAKMQYPRDRFEIQILDDSTDDTLDIINERADFWRSQGIEVQVRHRPNRGGFKAGALKEGTPDAKGEFLAIFDADFRPLPDFLLRTIPYFQDPVVGVVQGRWGHLNRDYSAFTRGQTLLHDAFFMIEQQARSMAGYFLRFNGSAGVWRRETIYDAGDWSGDTLSEDLDLCLRAQMKGWKIQYDQDVEAPAEIPVNMVDLKVQQYRWTKGRGQVIRKLLPTVIRTPMPIMVKLHAVFDLLNVFIIPGILLLAFSSVWYIYILYHNPALGVYLLVFSFALINVALAPMIGWLCMLHYGKGDFWNTLREFGRTFPAFLAIIVGIPFFQMVALIDGLFSRSAFFHRTAKYNIQSSTDSWRKKMYAPSEVPALTWFEGGISLFFLFAIFLDFALGMIGFLPFHILLFVSYGTVFTLSFQR